MKSMDIGTLTGSLVRSTLLLMLVIILGCSCKPETEISPPTVTPFPTIISSSTPGNPTSVPKEVAELEPDTSLLTDNPCRVPCWHNITPGVSDVNHVRAQLEDSPFVRKDSLRYGLTEEAGVPISRFSWQAKSEHYNRITLRNEMVRRIEIYIDHDWTLGDVVDKFGEPEYVVARQYGEEAPGYLVVVYLPAQGLQFHSSTYPFEGSEYGIARDLKVTMGVYFAPATLERMMSEAYLCPPEKMDTCRLDDVHKWRGFED